MLYAIFSYPESGYPGNGEFAQKCGLKVGEKYEVEYISMGQSYTSIELKGNENDFNSVLFDFEDENGASVNIYRDPRYNPYLNY